MPKSPQLSQMLARAMERKAAAIGSYVYRDLARDSGVDYTYAHKTVRYGIVPSRDVIKQWARALVPYFPEDEALIAAGFVPDGEAKRRRLSELWTQVKDEADIGLQQLGDAAKGLPDEPEQEAVKDDADAQPNGRRGPAATEDAGA